MPLSSNENILMIREAHAMLNRHQRPQPHHTTILIKACLVLTLTLIFFLLPASVSARTTRPTVSGPTLQVNAGFNARYRDGNWIPVQVVLSNSGTDFSGTLSINVPAPFAGQG